MARTEVVDEPRSERTREALFERAMRPVQAKAAIDTGYGDLIAAAPGRQDATEMPRPVRAKMEAAFGADFSEVRVHPGSARAVELGALAFTQGSDIHMAPGQWRPETANGQQLLGHELGHVLQQRAGRVTATAELHGVRLNDEPALEAEADEMGARAARADAGRPPASPDHAPSVAVQPAAVQRAPAPYDKTRYTFTPKPADLTLANVKAALKQKKDAEPADITSWSTSGVTAGSTEELYVLYTVWQLAKAARWGTEVDVLTEVGPGKKGSVTVRIDAAGNAVGELIASAAPAVVTTYATEAEAITGLKSTYKLSDVRGEKGRTWDLPALNKVAAAWARLGPAEAAALEGFELIRTDTLVDPSGDTLAGLTTHGNATTSSGLAMTKTRQIRIADSAFDADKKAFVGDSTNAAPASTMTLLHEAAHAIERKVVEDAEAAEVSALVDVNKAINAGNTSATKAVRALNGAIRKWNRFKAADQTASKPYIDALQAAFAAIEAFRAEPDPTKMPALDTAAQAAITARNTAKATVPATNPAHAAFSSAVTEQDAYLAAVQNLLAKRNALSSAKTATAATKDPTGTRSKRLQNFVDFVTKNNIAPVTDYAKKNWPAHPEEFFAEALTLWRSDPKFFGKYSSALKTWFDNGEHLK